MVFTFRKCLLYDVTSLTMGHGARGKLQVHCPISTSEANPMDKSGYFYGLAWLFYLSSVVLHWCDIIIFAVRACI